jgi:ribosomal protein L44E
MVQPPNSKKFDCKFCKKRQTDKVAAASRSEEQKVALGRRRYERNRKGSWAV